MDNEKPSFDSRLEHPEKRFLVTDQANSRASAFGLGVQLKMSRNYGLKLEEMCCARRTQDSS